MPNKKYYWTQVFIITTLMSCGLGLASGFVWSEQTCDEKRFASLPKGVAYIQLEAALQKSSTQAYQGDGNLCPLALPGAKVISSNSPILQPGATLLQLQAYYGNEIPPYYNNEQAMPTDDPITYEQCGKQLRLEGIPNPNWRGYKPSSGPCHGILDLSSPTIVLPMLIIAAFFLRKRFIRQRA